MYRVKYKLLISPFWKRLEVCGHQYSAQSDRMDFFLTANQGVVSIAPWKLYCFQLGEDFFEFQKEQAEEQAGQAIPMKKNK